MKVKNEYLKMTRKYLHNLYFEKLSIPDIESNIEDLLQKEKLYEINYDKNFSSEKSNKGIDDFIVSITEQIFNEESKIEHINKKYDRIQKFINKYRDIEKLIIIYKYFSRKKDNSNYTNIEIAKKLETSLATIKRVDNKIITKIALFLFKDVAIKP